MTPSHTRRKGKLYRYYVSTDVLKRDAASCPIRRVPAGEIENAVIDQLRGLLRAPEIVVRTWRAARQIVGDISEAEVREALERLDPLWNELFPAEQARIVQLLVERVDVQVDRLDVRLRTAGLTKLVGDLRERPDRCAEGRMTTAHNLSCYGEALIVQIPLRLRKRGGRKLMIAAEGHRRAAAGARRQRDGCQTGAARLSFSITDIPDGPDW